MRTLEASHLAFSKCSSLQYFIVDLTVCSFLFTQEFNFSSMEKFTAEKVLVTIEGPFSELLPARLRKYF